MNSSGWHKFRRQQAAERDQLRRLLARVQLLLAKCSETAPDEIELSALAATLHSFYTGVENIFKRVSVELDGTSLRGEAWHRELLLCMARPGPNRPALLCPELHDALLEYLRFRHVFRNAYSFDLDWAKMSPLVLRLGETLHQVERSLDVFLGQDKAGESGKPEPLSGP